MPRKRPTPQQVIRMLLDIQVWVERWRKHYSQARPHSVLGYRRPAPEAIQLPPLALGQEHPTDWATMAQTLT